MTHIIWNIQFWQVEYLLSCAMSFGISFLFAKTEGQKVFKFLWVYFFIIIGLIFLLIAFSGFVGVSDYMRFRFSILITSGTAVLTVMTFLFLYLFENYFKR